MIYFALNFTIFHSVLKFWISKTQKISTRREYESLKVGASVFDVDEICVRKINGKNDGRFSVAIIPAKCIFSYFFAFFSISRCNLLFLFAKNIPTPPTCSPRVGASPRARLLHESDFHVRERRFTGNMSARISRWEKNHRLNRVHHWMHRGHMCRKGGERVGVGR